MEQRNIKIGQIIKDLAEDLRNDVARIEESVPTTKDHYGAYMLLISNMETDNMQMLVAIALMKAGANQDGVRAALNISLGKELS